MGDSRTSRRELLRRSAVAGGAAALLPALASDAVAGGNRNPGRRPPAYEFLANEQVNFQALAAFGAVAYGTSDFGELTTIVDRINARGATYDAIYDVWTEFAERTSAYADAALDRGRTVTARSSYLRSASYHNQALFFVLGTKGPDRELGTFRAMNDAWASAAALFDPPIEPVAIPYETTTMPGWLMKPGGSEAPRPTIILNNGSDGQNIDLYSFGGAAAVERGWNALIFEGPGQGSMLFERGIPFRPDWEAVVTPIVDYLLTRPDVDPSRIATSGWSMSGELVARAAAFEHRLAAVVLDPGVTDVLASWPLPKELIELVNAGKRREVNEIWAEVVRGANAEERFNLDKRAEIFRAADGFTLLKDLQAYSNADVIHQITAPTLVTSPQLEEFYPGQPEQLYALLTAPKELVRFTVAQGAQFHCEPMAPQFRNEVVYDWLESTLGL
jgi:dienelactone hydrolase